MWKWLKRLAIKYSLQDLIKEHRAAGLRTAGIKVDEKSALTNTAVYDAVRVISETTASLPLPVYRRMPNGGRQKFREHPAYSLLNVTPNGEVPAMAWRDAKLAHVLSWGNGYSEIETTRGGELLALWTICPDKVTPERDKTGRVHYKVEGSSVPVPAERMLHWRGLGFDPLIGYSPIKMFKKAIGLGLAMEAFGAAYFENGAKPGGIISHPSKPSEVAQKNIRESLDEIHAGPYNYGKNLFLVEGMTYTPMSIPPEDSQFLQSRQFQVQEIARIFRVPPHLLGDLSNATYSNIEEEGLNFITHTIRPWCVRIEQEINYKLFRENERKELYCQHLFEGFLRGKTLERTQALTQQFLNGNLTLDEWREIEDRNPIEDPDKHFVPMNLTTLGAVMRAAEEAKQKEEEPPKEEPQPQPIETPVEETPTDEPQKEEVIKAARLSLENSLTTLAKRETNAVLRAAKKPNEFFNFLDTFYEDNERKIVEAITPALKTWAVLTNEKRVAVDLAKDICERHKAQLIEASGVTPDKFQEAIAETVSSWSREEIIAQVDT